MTTPINFLHIDILAPMKQLWRLVNSLALLKRQIRVSPFAHWNKQTTFGGNNIIHAGTVIGGCAIGRYTYINRACYLPNCCIGSFCSIAQRVRVVCYRHPVHTFVSISPVFFSTAGQCAKTFVQHNLFEEEKLVDGRCAIIGNDVWIGEDVRIIEGVRIGDGAVVGTGAVVTKDVPPYSIVGGVPAKIIGHRFSEEQAAFLAQTKWWDKDDTWLTSHAHLFADIENFMKTFNQK